MSSCTAILLAGGLSKRLGFDKILTPLCGKPVVVYSFEALQENQQVTDIVVVVHPDHEEEMSNLLASLNPVKPFTMAHSGEERFDSVWNALQKVKRETEYVLIHDGSRPLLTDHIINKTFAAAKISGAAVCATKAKDTLKKVEGHCVIENIDRAQVWQMQTPQIFKYDLIIKAYKKVIEEKTFITDDAQAVEAVGGRVEVVDPESFNRKITTPSDWEVIGAYLGKRQGAELRQAVHELNNALNPIVGYLPMLEKVLDQPEKLKEYIEKMKSSTPQIQKSSREIQSLVNNLFPKA
jgi:2-C-methyl-D-erythritol 4-phosphate cytidylyltransferase